MKRDETGYRVLVVDLDTGTGKVRSFGDRSAMAGGSGLAAYLFEEYGRADLPPAHPDQPLIFAVGPLTGYFPLMSKTVLGFMSPYNSQYAESHAGGRLASCIRLAGYDALVVRGEAAGPACLIVGSRSLEIRNVQYLWGMDALSAGKWLRRVHKGGSGQRSIIRIGPAGERGVSFACVNVDTYRHFGRLGAGAIMGSKKLKAMIVLGDGSLELPAGKAYEDLYREIYRDVTGSPTMRKYHDLGTPENLVPLNEMEMLPWRNLRSTSDPAVESISGERFADSMLLRKTACAGCPVGCVHVGLLREKFGGEHEYLYRQVSYDYEPIFAVGTMLGMTDPSDVLALIEETDRQGLDVMSAGVSLAWAAEAMGKGMITERETVGPLEFGSFTGFRDALRRLASGENEFFRTLGLGTLAAASKYGGEDFACVLGQEMAGYATGEVYFVSQALGFRHSHLDTGAYGFDQKNHGQDDEAAVRFLLEEEKSRVQLTSMVACLFARNIYTQDRLAACLESIGLTEAARALPAMTQAACLQRWRMKFLTGFDPSGVKIPKRFTEVVTVKGPVDSAFMERVRSRYANALKDLVRPQVKPGGKD